MSSPYDVSDDLPVYVISVAAQLSGMHPQTLRHYERIGLVSPGRSAGRGRRYSMRDILALREIQRLSQEEGVNLAGVKLILDQLRELEQARRLIAELHAELAQLRVELESTRAVAARLAGLRRVSPDSGGSDNRSGRAGLVPVRDTRVAMWEPTTGPSGDPGPSRGDK
jgi:MerR family transcriptional regulator/heat shock protein HspR